MDEQPKHMDALLFDSGVGGISILDEILELRPELSFAYFADWSGLPYGNKSTAWLEQRVSQAIRWTLQHYRPQLIIIACNTASTHVLPRLRAEHALVVVGVVPAIKPAAALSRTLHVGLLATPGTVQRPYTEELILNFAKHCRVTRVGTSRLVELVEAYLGGETLPLAELQDLLKPFVQGEDSPDVIVLGCTHFPFIKQELQQILGPCQLIDSGAAIARRVDQLLPAHSVAPRLRHFFYTGEESRLLRLTGFLEQRGLHSFTKVSEESLATPS